MTGGGMRLLLLDSTAHYPSNPLFLEALEGIELSRGLQWSLVDEARLMRSGLLPRIANRVIGQTWGVRSLNRALLNAARALRPHLVLIVKGAHVAPDTLAAIRLETGAQLVNYATDDPFNPLVSTPALRASIPQYDLYACTKRAIIEDVRAAGGKHVLYVPFAYKPLVHFHEEPASEWEESRFSSDVLFVGGCDGDRIPYFEALINDVPNLDLGLYGGFWDRHPTLARYHRGFAVGRDYRLALGSAKIVVNLVRKANRDGHVMRTFEIPATKAFMLAERTPEHLELFRDGREIVCFSTPTELVAKVRHYLARPEERARIARHGHRVVITGRHRYEDRLVDILDAIAGR